jgi:hypothetical protein
VDDFEGPSQHHTRDLPMLWSLSSTPQIENVRSNYDFNANANDLLYFKELSYPGIRLILYFIPSNHQE